MDSSVSPKYEIWFLRVCHQVSTDLYADSYRWRLAQQVTSLQLSMNQLTLSRHLNVNIICLPRVTVVLFVQFRCDARVTGHSKAATAWTASGFTLPPLCANKRYSFVWDVNAVVIGSSSLTFRDTQLFLSSRAELLDR